MASTQQGGWEGTADPCPVPPTPRNTTHANVPFGHPCSSSELISGTYPLPADDTTQLESHPSPSRRFASVPESVLSETAQEMNEKLLRAARSWQEEHKEWQKRYSQWLLDQSQWECRRTTGGDTEGTLHRVPSTSKMVSGVFTSAMKKMFCISKKATVLVCTKTAHQTKTRLVPAAKRLGRRLVAFSCSKNAPSQQVQGEQVAQQHQIYLLRVQQQRLMEEQLLQEQHREFLNREQQQEEQRHQQQERLQAQLSTPRPQEQIQHQTSEAWHQWQQGDLQEGGKDVLSRKLGSSDAVGTSGCKSKTPKSPIAAQEVEAPDSSAWVDEEKVLNHIQPSIDWIVDVGLNSAARAAAASALQRREKLQQQNLLLQGKKTKGDPSRGSSRATCCDTASSAEELHQKQGHRRISRERPLLQTARPQPPSPSRPRRRSRTVVVEPPRCQDNATECSVEDCVIHCNGNSSDTPASESSSSSYLVRQLRTARRLRAAAAAARRRQVLLAQRRAQAAKREELCYGEVDIDCAL